MDNLLFRAMEQKEFDKHINDYLEEYIENLLHYEKEFTETMKIDPRKFAEKQFRESLPEGINSPNNFFWVIVNKERLETIGFFWFNIILERHLCVISELKLFDTHDEISKLIQIFNFIEKYLKQTHPEIDNLYLHVFKHQISKQELYESCGFNLFYESFEGVNLIKNIAQVPQ